MENKKKLGEIYREKLRDVETTPPADSWDNISAALEEKEEKKAFLPLWWKFAGSAAVIALLVSLFYFPQTETKFSSEPTLAVPAERKSYEFDPISPFYEETLLRTSVLLEMLIQKDLKAPSSERIAKKTAEESNEPAANTIAANRTEETQQKMPFLDSLESRVAKENANREEITSEKAIVTTEEETSAAPHFNEIEQAVAENESPKEITEKNDISGRFSVTTTAAAVYFDNFGSGNALNAQFAGQDSKGKVSMAYGINLAYQVSDKVKIRTGVSKVELNQTTGGASFGTVMDAAFLDGNTANIASPGMGNLEQNLGFIEIPMEMEYSLFKKQFGINIIGGASALILDENQVSLDSPYATMSLGEANNLNNLSFSANLGLGLNYDISKDFQLHLEPIFKYQLNTFSNTPGLNPYYFGVYSGLSYKF